MKNEYFAGLCLLVFVTASERVHAQQVDLDVVVSIYAEKQSGVDQGTGFVALNRTTVVTAYHVIAGSTKITAHSQGKTFKVVEVVGVAPDADLAVLRLDQAADGQPLKLVDELPTTATALKVVGRPRGMSPQQVSTAATKDGGIRSTEFSDSSGRRMITSNLELVPLNLLVYGGLSGAPLLNSRNQVVGIVSGSLNEGGSLAWAIPSKYALNLLESQPTSIVPSAAAKWPVASAIRNGARMSTRSLSLSLTSDTLLQQYRASRSGLGRSDTALRNGSVIVPSAIERFCSSLKIGLEFSSRDMRTETIVRMERDLGVYKPFNGETAFQTSAASQSSIHTFAIDYVRTFSKAVRARNVASASLRSSMSTLLDKLTAEEISSDERKLLSEVQKEIRVNFPELVSSTADALLGIDAGTVSDDIDKLASKFDFVFASRDEAVRTSGKCESSIRASKAYTEFFGSSKRLFDDEMEMFDIVGALFEEFEPYLIYGSR